MKSKTKAHKFPSVVAVCSALVSEYKYLRRNFSRNDLLDPYDKGNEFAGTDIRLQVYENGNWAIRSGSSDYDQDHRGFWGASSLSFDRQNLTDLARDLIEQAKEMEAMQVDFSED